MITPVVTFLYHWLGWGSWIIAVAAGWGGIWAFRRQKARAVKVRLSQVLALEGSALTLVAWLSAAGGGLLDRAEAGLDGGIIGWGLTEILGIIGLTP
ncbi:MAG: hypothetical protein M1281_08230, partial [Chloroflexi bacterium]|nr:hypothetical protein [Chloroflexota bacterium]